MTISSLSQIPHSEIHTTFIRAFSDYQIPVDETLEEMIMANTQRGVDYSASFGSFSDDGALTGFIFCGVRREAGALMYYDGATAVVPSWRGRGVGGLLLDKALADAKSRGAYAFVLEVIQENLKAQRLYESHGFSISRNLRCLQKQREAIHSMEPSDSELHIPDADEFLMIAKTIPLPYTPSWQNTNASVTSIFGNLTTRVLNHKGHPVGYFVLYPPTGHVLQLSAKDDNPIIFQELLSHAKAFTNADSLKFINIEETSPFISFLEAEGWTLLIDQYEMIRYFEHEEKA